MDNTRRTAFPREREDCGPRDAARRVRSPSPRSKYPSVDGWGRWTYQNHRPNDSSRRSHESYKPGHDRGDAAEVRKQLPLIATKPTASNKLSPNSLPESRTFDQPNCGEDSLPTPASPAPSQSASRRTSMDVARHGKRSNLASDADVMDVDQPGKRPPGRVSIAAPTADMWSAGSFSNSNSNGNTVGRHDRGAMQSEGPHASGNSAPALRTSTANPHSLSRTRFTETLLKLQSEKDAQLISLLLHKQKEEENRLRLAKLDEDLARFGGMSLSQDHAKRIMTQRQKLQADLDYQIEKRLQCQDSRAEYTSQIADLFDDVVRSSEEKVDLSHSSTFRSSSDQTLANHGPSARDFAQLKQEVESLRQASVPSTSTGLFPNEMSLRKEIADLKRDLISVQLKVNAVDPSVTARSKQIPVDCERRLEEVSDRLNSLDENVRNGAQSTSALQQDVKDALSNRTNAESQLKLLDTRIGRISEQLDQQNRSAPQEMATIVRKQLEEYTGTSRGESLREELAKVNRDIETVRSRTDDLQVTGDTLGLLSQGIDELRKSIGAVNNRAEEIGSQLQIAKADISRLSDKFSSSLIVQPQEARSSFAPNTPWGNTRTHSSRGLHTPENQAIWARIHTIETWLQGITIRMNELSMEPQVKALLGLVLKQVPNSQQVLNELAAFQTYRHGAQTRLDSDSREISELSRQLHELGARVDNSNLSSVHPGPTQLQASVNAVTAELQTLKVNFESKDEWTRERLEGLALKQHAFETLAQAQLPGIAKKMEQFEAVLDDTTIRKLQSLPENVDQIFDAEIIRKIKSLEQRLQNTTNPDPTMASTSTKEVNSASAISKERPMSTSVQGKTPKPATQLPRHSTSISQSNFDTGQPSESDEEMGDVIEVPSKAKNPPGGDTASPAATSRPSSRASAEDTAFKARPKKKLFQKKLQKAER